MAVLTAHRTVTLPNGEIIPSLGQGTWHMAEDPRRRTDEIDGYRHSLSKKTSEQMNAVGIDSLSLEAFVRETAQENQLQLAPLDATPAIVDAVKGTVVGER